jgi:hypothetical protein
MYLICKNYEKMQFYQRNFIIFTVFKKTPINTGDTSNEVVQLLAHGRWFSLGTPASSTTKTGGHGIAEILLTCHSDTSS